MDSEHYMGTDNSAAKFTESKGQDGSNGSLVEEDSSDIEKSLNEREDDECEETKDEEDKEEAEEVVEDEETYEYTESEIKEMRVAFTTYDSVKNDTIPIRCLGSVLRALGQNPSEQQLRDHARWLDADPRSGVVRFKEFLIIMGRTLTNPITTERTLEGFRCLDDDHTGIVTKDKLRGVLTTIGEPLSPKEFLMFMKHADPKKKEFVKYDDFVLTMNGYTDKVAAKKQKKEQKGKKKR